ncbi:MAG: DUF167 domain-containing protein [Rhodospirillaceae bacterium]|nr:DUF167 domain-containing protein [Rhodospirillaceae bacterium]
MSTSLTFYRVTQGGLTLSVRATPKASRDAVSGIMQMPDGVVLKISVTAPPDKGQANDAVCRLIAAKLGLPKSAVAVISGHTDRRKVVHVSGDPETLVPLMQSWTP